MRRLRKAAVAAGVLSLGLCGTRMGGRNSNDDARNEIEAFNKKFVELHLKMDTPGILAMWAEDGVDLMPGETPIAGGKAITAWIENILSKMRGYKMAKEEIEFHDIQVCGDWASEWATEHQVVQPPDGKPAIEGFGKMPFVLHRERSGEWKIRQEMWNGTPRP